MHTVIDKQKNHDIRFPVLAKTLHMFCEHRINSDTIVDNLEGERDITLDFVNLVLDDFIELYNAYVIQFIFL